MSVHTRQWSRNSSKMQAVVRVVVQKVCSKSGNSLQLPIQIKSWHRMPDKYALFLWEEECLLLGGEKSHIFFNFVIDFLQSFCLLLDIQCKSVSLTELD